MQGYRRVMPFWQLCTQIFIPFNGNKQHMQVLGLCVRQCTGNFDNRRKSAKYSTVSYDDMDSFVDKLMLEKVDKWQKRSHRKCILNETSEACTSVHLNTKNIELCGTDNVDKRFSEMLLISDAVGIHSLLVKCCNDVILPSSDILVSVMKWCSRHGYVANVKIIQELWKQVNIEEYKLQAGFRHYLAESLWVSGNIEKALKLNYDIYKSNAHLRRELHHMLKFLISHVLHKRGEAPLVLLKKFCIDIYKEFRDIIFLSHLWYSCFHSTWFSDNCLANDLLEEIPALREHIRYMMSSIAVRALQKHKVDMVQRLFEIMLQYNMDKEYSGVLRILFDYSCMQRDIQSCKAIMKSAEELNVVLFRVQYERYEHLLNTQGQLTSQFKEKTSSEVQPFNIKF